jgi:hypothetical protein
MFIQAMTPFTMLASIRSMSTIQDSSAQCQSAGDVWNVFTQVQGHECIEKGLSARYAFMQLTHGGNDDKQLIHPHVGFLLAPAAEKLPAEALAQPIRFQQRAVGEDRTQISWTDETRLWISTCTPPFSSACDALLAGVQLVMLKKI